MILKERQEKLLKCIIEDYIATATPVGSKRIIEKYIKDISAATIRNDMALLEKCGFLDKNHTSSGRIPSNKGYKYYEKNFSKGKLDVEIKLKLKKVFADRHSSINSIISQSVKILSEVMNLPTIRLEQATNLTLKRVDLVVINEKTALIILITSSGELIKNIIDMNDKKNLKDLSICIRIFNDRLIDCPLVDIKKRIEVIQNIIKQKVDEYEFIMQEVIERIFNMENKPTHDVHGSSYLVSLPEFQNHAKLQKVLRVLENSSVWELIAFKQQQSGQTTSIVFGDEIGEENILFASTNIVINDENSTQISMVGPTRIDYSKIKGLLDFIKYEIERNWKK
ncbi:MAG: heat-inducible transcriptional repressor HrcA [Malacoplasma sp.]